MSRLLARLILAMTVPLAMPVIFALIFMVIEKTLYRRDYHALLATCPVSALIFVVAWIGIWRPQVSWTPSRRSLTALSVLWSIGVGTIFGLLVTALTNEEALGVIVGAVFWMLSWIVSTALVWQESIRERASRIRGMTRGAVACLKCGYNMTGLHEARCPECGTQFTLDELLAAQTELEDELAESSGQAVSKPIRPA